jgi:hypothetical protein
VSARDFDWGEGNSNVVLRAYGSIAVHENPYGDVVIRQERDAMEDDDHWVVVPVQDAELVAQAIIDKANEIKRGDPPPPPQVRETKPAPLALPAPCNKRPPSAGPGLPLSGTHNGVARHG